MNSFGHSFRLSIFGESHGPAVGVIIDGVPAGLELKEEDFLQDLGRRWPDLKGVSSRRERDIPQIKSGWLDGRTTGTPLTIIFANERVDSAVYEELRWLPRPGHADFAAWRRSGGYNDWRGGGHFSGRLTVGLVAAGVVAKKIILPIKVGARLEEVGGSKAIEAAVEVAGKAKDSVGGIISCQAKPMPVGLGEPFFDSVESVLAHLLFSVPGVKAIEFGSGFQFSRMRGSEANDIILDRTGKTKTNHNGGIVGGLSNGNELFLRVAVKPTSSIGRPQKTVDLRTGEIKTIEIKGRHDVCFALRLPVVVEAAVAIGLADLRLRAKLPPPVWGYQPENLTKSSPGRRKG
ncbi:MAG: chorismate synthase [Candidatus Aminicenantales bacterium]